MTPIHHGALAGRAHPFSRRALARATAIAAGALVLAPAAQAFDVDTGNPDLAVRFDNTVKLSTAYRPQNADQKLASSFSGGAPQALNFNAGDDNFRNKGIVSRRVDLLSEFDVVYQRRFGFRISGAAWYDDVYHRSSDASDPFNGQSPTDRFPDHTQRIAGGDAEVLDAFLFGSWDLGEHRLSARLGRHALQYGESLFFGDNGIARAQGPIDINKLMSSPNAQFKEIIRPVPQVSGQLQLSQDVSIGGYVQFGWEADRLPPAGSYFSTANIPWGSKQSELVGIPAGPLAGNHVLAAGSDRKPSDYGQFGLQLKWRIDETDLGFYFARYHDKGGQLYGALNVFNPAAGQWFYVFPEATKTVGFSASHTFGDVNLAMEASVRDNMPLRSGPNIIYPAAFVAQPRHATGKTAHVNFSWLANFGPNLIARESSLVGEIAWNRALSVNDPDHELEQTRTRDATAIQLVYTPTYRQAMPGLDLSVPIGLRYTLDGRSSVTAWEARGNGTFTLGVEGNYLSVWQFGLTYAHYIGKAVPFVDVSPALSGGSAIFGDGNALADRDHVALYVRRTF
ncbi:MAG: DUF1302 family protein [Rhodocyclales bacterium GT-UBC]|nr:MAG: DUF1302 family protein [Rhodocyclales bacterium GT-UBC]